MKTSKIKYASSILVTLAAAVLICFLSQGALALDMPMVGKAEYVPNQIIIKLKNTPAVSSQLSQPEAGPPQAEAISKTIDAKTNKVSEDTLSAVLPGLNIKKVEKIFKDTPMQKKEIANKLGRLNTSIKLQTAEKAVEEKRLNRLLQAEEKKKELGLDKIYLIEVDDQNILPIIENLKQNSSIVYA